MKLHVINPKGDMNFHTHTTYCDGKDTPREMADRAVELGFRALGFSGHGFLECDTDCCMTREGEDAYFREISDMKEEYRGVLDIRVGLERDYYNRHHFHPYDYEIGSVHYVEKDGYYTAIDDTPERLEEGVNRCFDGDFRAFCERYFELESEVLQVTGAEIVGHFDLIRKLNHGNRFFNENAAWYKDLAISAVRKIAKTKVKRRSTITDLLGESDLPIFEINTGGMAKGYRSTPYPADFILDEIARLGLPVILQSDCHDRKKLNYAFSDLLPKLNAER
ncbi:MAG: histidinol-phosphatase [Eubacteriales bacterium]|nr:histidinol-phosphatase [Eubacteriales bacterium]